MPDLVGSSKISPKLEEISIDLVEIFLDLRLREKGRVMVNSRGVHELVRVGFRDSNLYLTREYSARSDPNGSDFT